MRFLALTVWGVWCFEDLKEKGSETELINESNNDKGVCRTALVTQGRQNVLLLQKRTLIGKGKHFEVFLG